MIKHPKKLLSIACWVLLLLCSLQWLAAAPDAGEARAEWMTGFVKLEAADQSVNENNLLAALPLYREALAIFEGVRRKHPQWNPSLLNYRINYCQQNIEKLESRVQSQSNTLSRDDLLLLQSKQAQELQTLQEEKRELTGKVEILTASLERARLEAAKTAGQDTALADLATAKANLEQKIGLLELRLREALADNEKLKDQAKFQEEATRLNAELTRLQTQFRQAQGDSDNLRQERENLTARNTELMRQLEWLQKQQKEQDTSLKVVRELAETRKKENDNLMLRLTGAEAKKELAEKTLADTVREQKRLQEQQSSTNAELVELRQIRGQHAKTQKELLQQQEKLTAQTLELTMAKKTIAALQEEAAKRLAAVAATPATGQDGAPTATAAIDDERDREIARLRLEITRLQAEKQRSSDTADIARPTPGTSQPDSLIVLNQRLQSNEAKLQRLEKELQQKTDDLQQARAQAVIKEEKHLELLTAAERLKQRLNQAEMQNQLLTAKFQETTIARDKIVADAETQSQQSLQLLEQAQNAAAALQNAEKRLQEQTALGRKLEAQITEQKGKLTTQETELLQMRQALAKAMTEKNQTLAQQISQAKEREMTLARLQLEKNDLLTKAGALEKEIEEKEELLLQQKQVAEKQQQMLADLNSGAKDDLQGQKIQQLLEKQMALMTQDKNDLRQKLRETQQKLAQQVERAENLQNKFKTLPELEEWQALQQQVQRKSEALEQQMQLLEQLQLPEDQPQILLTKIKELNKTLLATRQASEAADEANREMKRMTEEVTRQNQMLGNKMESLQQELNKVKKEQKRLLAEKLAAEKTAAESSRKAEQEYASSTQSEKLAEQWKEKFQRQSQMLIALEETVGKLQQEKKFLQAKTEVVDGLAKTLADSTAECNQARERLTAMQKQLEVLRDRNLDLEQQAQKQVETLAKLQSLPATDDAWVSQLQEVNRRLDREMQRRKALESALLEMENKSGAAAPRPAESEAATSANSASPASDTVQARENRIRYEQERVAVIRGFLRQGLDAERQAKIEAARWNYQQVLELESDNAFALQRLGILAANTGNDLDTMRYLQQAFRQNPDDLDTLLALGFAQVRQSQPDWAVATLGRAVSLYPDNIDAARAYGIALLTMGWTQAAEVQLKKTAKMKPEDAETAFNLAVLLATAEPPRLHEAAQWYEKAVQNGAQPDPGLDAALKLETDK